MSKLIKGGFIVVAVAAIAGYATYSYFSDTETSTGNSFTAGAIDLTVDSTQHYNSMICANVNGFGSPYVWIPESASPANYTPADATTYNTANPAGFPKAGTSCDGSWTATDLGAQKFFNFTDVKPGDSGEDTISLNVTNNDAWACVDVNVTKNDDVSLTEPEQEAGDVANTGSLLDGELAQNLYFTAWADDGDNVWETNEPLLFSNTSGPASDVLNGKTYALADSTTSGGPLTGTVTKYVGLAWCAGTQTVTSTNHTITCNGAGMGNNTQTDMMEASIAFRAVQSRNNTNFICSDATVVRVGANNLAPNFTDVAAHPEKWFMYNDDPDPSSGGADYGIDNTLGTFVAGPPVPFYGTGSIQFTLGAAPNSRKNIATYKFSGTPLASITQMSFGAYSHSGFSSTESPFLNFNVDFNGSDTWQRRLVYVPSGNGSAPQDTWNNYDAIQGGAAKWVLSGGTWPGDGFPATTQKAWSSILSQYPGVRIRVTDSWLGIRVGEPGPTGYVGNVDFFKIATGGAPTVYDFEN